MKKTVNKRLKYGNKKAIRGGIKFDSKLEAERYDTLSLLERVNVIKELVLQPEFLLQPSFVDKEGNKHRAIKYRADFQYTWLKPDKNQGRVIIEDVKGMETEVFKIKRKLLLFRYPEINFQVVK